MRTKIECCRYCDGDKRKPGCHATCPEYKRERAELDKENNDIKIAREADRYIQSMVNKSLNEREIEKKNKKGYHKHGRDNF